MDFLNNGQVPKLGSNEAVYIRANRDPGGGDGDEETSVFDGVVTEGSVSFLFDNGRDLPAYTQIRVYPAEGPRTQTLSSRMFVSMLLVLNHCY